MPDSHEPLILIVSGPSGSGKSTLVKKLLELPGTMLSISATTRPPRAGERDGEWYHFVSDKEFQGMVGRDEFLEFASVFGLYNYGTPKKSLDQARAQEKDLVLEIDVQGAAQVRKKVPESVAIFIVPPSREELEKRIRARGQDNNEDIARRLDRARLEMEDYVKYDYVVINENVEQAAEAVRAIVLEKRRQRGRNVEQAGEAARAVVLEGRCRRGQNRERVQRILKSFGG